MKEDKRILVNLSASKQKITTFDNATLNPVTQSNITNGMSVSSQKTVKIIFMDELQQKCHHLTKKLKINNQCYTMSKITKFSIETHLHCLISVSSM